MNNKEILITGGTGTLGNALVRYIKEHFSPRGIRIYSRSELRMAHMFEDLKREGLSDNIEFIIGDVRDFEKLKIALQRVDYVIHAAALKRIEVGEKDPDECLETNSIGTKHVRNACIANRVEKALFISTDKAYAPITVYGYTKALAENMWLHGNTLASKAGTKFATVRYGNVFDSNGSVVEIFRRQKESGRLTLTDPEMTRFWIKKKDVCEFICNCFRCITSDTSKREFIPQMRSSTIASLAIAIAPNAIYETIGLRCTEKLHEQIDDWCRSNDPNILMTTEQLKRWIDE